MMETYLIAIPGLLALGFGAGYYLGERGTAGVQIDLDNAQRELQRLKDLVAKKTDTKTVTVTTPAGSTKPTTTVTNTTTPSK